MGAELANIISEFEKGNIEVLSSSPAGGIVRLCGEAFIIYKTSVELGHKHIFPRSPEEEAQRLKQDLDRGFVDMVCIEGSMRSGKSTTLGILAHKYLEEGLSVSYFRPGNARPLDKEDGLPREVVSLVAEPNSKEEFLDSLNECTDQLITIDELNIAQFLPGDMDSEKFFSRFIELVHRKLLKRQRIGIGLLDRQFNAQSFAPVELLREFVVYYRNAEFSHMQAVCIGCFGRGQVSNRAELIGNVDGTEVYRPVSLAAPVQGIDNVYIPLCRHCFSKANNLKTQDGLFGITDIPLGHGFSLRDANL